MRMKCWRCGKRRVIKYGTLRCQYIATLYYADVIDLRIPNPICNSCYDSFIKWAVSKKETK